MNSEAPRAEASERDTRQRRAIRSAIEEAGRPLSPQEILEQAQRAVPRMGIATVYRTVNRLVEEGWAETVELPDGPIRYERAGKAHHHHFVCRNCESVYDVGGCLRGVGDLAPAGFQIDGHEIVLYGRCGRCAA